MQTLEITERFFNTFCHTYCKFYKNKVCSITRNPPQIHKCPIPEFAEFNQQLVKIKTSVNKIISRYDLDVSLKTKGKIEQLMKDGKGSN